MTRASPKKGINKDLEKAISDMLKEAMKAGSDYSVTDKMKVIDRALKLEQIKQKMDDATFGSGFNDD